MFKVRPWIKATLRLSRPTAWRHPGPGQEQTSGNKKKFCLFVHHHPSLAFQLSDQTHGCPLLYFSPVSSSCAHSVLFSAAACRSRGQRLRSPSAAHIPRARASRCWSGCAQEELCPCCKLHLTSCTSQRPSPGSPRCINSLRLLNFSFPLHFQKLLELIRR